MEICEGDHMFISYKHIDDSLSGLQVSYHTIPIGLRGLMYTFYGTARYVFSSRKVSS